jgi:hypothetical protein
MAYRTQVVGALVVVGKWGGPLPGTPSRVCVLAACPCADAMVCCFVAVSRVGGAGGGEGAGAEKRVGGQLSPSSKSL